MRLAKIAAASAALAFSSTPAWAQQAQPILAANESLLRTEATGRVLREPDAVSFTSLASAEADTPAQAVALVGERLDRMISAVRALRIDGVSIESDRVVLSPIESAQDDDDDGLFRSNPIVRYRSRNAITITMARIDRASDVLAALITAGATGLDGPSFDLSEPSRERADQEAEAAAIARARIQADRQAAAVGMRVSRVVYIGNVRAAYEGGDIIVTGSSIRAGVRIEPSDVVVTRTLWIDFAMVPR